MIKVTTVRFYNAGKLYDFEPAPFNLKVGDNVIVETSSGEEFATVAFPLRKVEKSDENELKNVIRKATNADIEKHKRLLDKAKEILPIVKNKAKELGLDMNIVDVEYTFDESKIIINFTAEERVDFRELLKVISSQLKKRVELRQIGIRDETKIVGGLGVCGQHCCCNRFLEDFGHVTVKMAKNQNLSLNPTKISGLCGRLMCCLAYENESYVEVQKDLPKLGSDVQTPQGKGKLVNVNVIRESATVKFEKQDETTMEQFNLCDISRCKDCPHECRIDDRDVKNDRQNNKQKKNMGVKNNGIQN